MRRALVCAVCCAMLLLAAAQSPHPAEAAVRDCRNYQFEVAFVYDFSVRNLRCKRAEYLQRGSYGRTGWHFRRARRAGFRCGMIGTVYEGAVYRCHKGGKAFRWTHGA